MCLMDEVKDGSLCSDSANEPCFIHLMLLLLGMYQSYDTFSDLSGTASIKCLQKGQHFACFKKLAQSPQGAFSMVWTPQALQCWETAAIKKPCYKESTEILLYCVHFLLPTFTHLAKFVAARKKPLYAYNKVTAEVSALPSFGYTHGNFHCQLNAEMSLQACRVCHLTIYLAC